MPDPKHDIADHGEGIQLQRAWCEGSLIAKDAILRGKNRRLIVVIHHQHRAAPAQQGRRGKRSVGCDCDGGSDSAFFRRGCQIALTATVHRSERPAPDVRPLMVPSVM